MRIKIKSWSCITSDSAITYIQPRTINENLKIASFMSVSTSSNSRWILGPHIFLMKTENLPNLRDLRAEGLKVWFIRYEDPKVLSFYNKDIWRFEGSINTWRSRICLHDLRLFLYQLILVCNMRVIKYSTCHLPQFTAVNRTSRLYA